MDLVTPDDVQTCRITFTSNLPLTDISKIYGGSDGLTRALANGDVFTRFALTDLQLAHVHREKGALAFRLGDGTTVTVLVSKNASRSRECECDCLPLSFLSLAGKYRVMGPTFASMAATFLDLLERLDTVAK